MIKGFLNLHWFLWATLALVVAVIYSFVWPQQAMTTATGFRFFMLRWGHTLTWILLAINFLLRGFSPSLNGAANLIALTGGLMYLLFIVMAFVVK
ncbi:MAG TPA: hypothetical protein VF896_08370 [Anaerolineales bacterium]